jgi:hypothetical protein
MTPIASTQIAPEVYQLLQLILRQLLQCQLHHLRLFQLRQLHQNCFSFNCLNCFSSNCARVVPIELELFQLLQLLEQLLEPQ